MANGKIRFGKQSGGVLGLVFPDGVTNTEVTLPESGVIAKISDINTAGIELQTIATGTATFTATTNNIKLTGIGVGLEIGDVILISGADDAKNNSEFTVEVITDANNIIVNQAHANKGTSKNVAARASDTGVTVKLLAKWYNASIGLGQGVVDMTASRAYSVVYTNNTRRTIQVYPSSEFSNSGGITLTVDSVVFPVMYSQYPGLLGSFTSFGTIPKGSTYLAAGQTLNKWLELR